MMYEHRKSKAPPFPNVATHCFDIIRGK